MAPWPGDEAGDDEADELATTSAAVVALHTGARGRGEAQQGAGSEGNDLVATASTPGTEEQQQQNQDFFGEQAAPPNPPNSLQERAGGCKRGGGSCR